MFLMSSVETTGSEQVGTELSSSGRWTVGTSDRRTRPSIPESQSGLSSLKGVPGAAPVVEPADVRSWPGFRVGPGLLVSWLYWISRQEVEPPGFYLLVGPGPRRPAELVFVPSPSDRFQLPLRWD